MKKKFLIVKLCTFVLTLLFLGVTGAQAADKAPLKIGYIGSLTNFAAAFGTAALEGAKLAVEELASTGTPVELYIEDDQSTARNTVVAYQKLRSTHQIDALITGTWWANSIVKTVERDGIPFISCETLYNKDFIEAQNYFTLQGDLREWIRVYEPLVKAHGWKSAGMIKFVSGFADTLRDELAVMFGETGRSFLKPIEYADIEMKDAATFATQLKELHPDVVYVDSQPSSFGTLMSRLIEQKATFTILANSSAHDALAQKLFDPNLYLGKIYFTTRDTFQPSFVEKFKGKYQREPILNADLGYYAAKLLALGTKMSYGTVRALKDGALTVDGIPFQFDSRNVFQGLKQNIFTIVNQKTQLVPLE